MKKKLLFALFAFIFGIGIVSAQNVNIMIDVDNAANIKVTVNNGATEVPIQDGMNRITQYSSANSPLSISAVDGAKIVSVTKNYSDALSPNYQGVYNMAIEAMMLSVVTEGNGGAPTVKTLDVWFQLEGDKGSATITSDGQNVDWSFDAYTKVQSGAECIIAPAAGYLIKNVTTSYGKLQDKGDGTWSFSTTQNWDFVTCYTEALPEPGVDITVLTSYYPNIKVQAGRYTSEDDEYKDLIIKEDGTVRFPDGWDFLQFSGVDNAEILGIDRNGTPLIMSPYVGWRATVAAGDVFTVNAQGAAQDVTFSAVNAFDGATLDCFKVVAAGKALSLSGNEQTVTLHRGDAVSVTGKGTNTVNWVGVSSKTIYVAPYEFLLAEGDTKVSISGDAASGITVTVNNAAAVQVKQANGYGAALTLKDGDNLFEMADIVNNLSITPAEGCQILSVTLDGDKVLPTADGSYSIVAHNGMLLDISARKIPATIPVTVSINDNVTGGPSNDLAAHVILTVNGEKQSLTSFTSLMPAYMAEVTVTSDFGYIIDEISAGANYIEQTDGVYTFYAENACMLNIRMHQVVAPEGYALVRVVANDSHVGFYPYSADMERLEGSIKPEVPGVVKIGDYVCVSKFAFDYHFKSITVNGEAIEITPSTEPRAEYYVKIEGDCTIEATLYNVNEGKVTVTAWSVSEGLGSGGIKIADLYIDVDGELVEHYQADPGETIKLVATYVAPGFKLEKLEGQSNYNVTPDLEGAGPEYTITLPEGAAINPATGDPYTYIWKPVCTLDATNPPYLVEFYETMLDPDGDPSLDPEADDIIGYLLGVQTDGVVTALMFAQEGDVIPVNVYSRDDFEFDYAYTGFGRTIFTGAAPGADWVYTVDPDDSFEFNGYSKINIAGAFKRKGVGIASIIAAGALSYDEALQTVAAPTQISIYTVSGLLVATGSETISVANLAPGLYIATAGTDTLKFIKH